MVISVEIVCLSVCVSVYNTCCQNGLTDRQNSLTI